MEVKMKTTKGEPELEMLRRLAGTGVVPEPSPDDKAKDPSWYRTDQELARMRAGIPYGELAERVGVSRETARRFCLDGTSVKLATAWELCRHLEPASPIRLLAKAAKAQEHVIARELGPASQLQVLTKILEAHPEPTRIKMSWLEPRWRPEALYLLRKWWESGPQVRETVVWFLEQEPSKYADSVRTAGELSKGRSS